MSSGEEAIPAVLAPGGGRGDSEKVEVEEEGEEQGDEEEQVDEGEIASDTDDSGSDDSEADEEDDDDDDDSAPAFHRAGRPPGVRVGMVGPSAAADVLRRMNRPDCPRIESIWVRFPSDPMGSRPAQQMYRDHLGDCVNELERHLRISEIRLDNGTFRRGGWEMAGDNASRVEQDLDRLFGAVLPHHPSLQRIIFDHSKIEVSYLQLLAEGVVGNPSSVLTDLLFESTHLGVGGGRLLGRMLRGTMVLGELRLWHCGLGPDGLRLLCEGAARVKKLKCLNVREGDAVVEPGIVAAAVRPGSNLEQLIVEARAWSRGAVVELLTALRSNASLVHVFVGQRAEEGPFPDAHLVEELLGSHNFTLRSLMLDPPSSGTDAWETAGPVAALLGRNGRVREVNAVLDMFEYQVPNRAVWPQYLSEISAFPKLLYRFARRGNVEAFAEQVTAASASSGRKRARDQRLTA